MDVTHKEIGSKCPDRISVYDNDTDLTHNDGTIYGKPQICQCGPYQADDTLHTIHFLTQEDIHGGEGAHFHKTSFHLIRNNKGSD